MFDQRATSGELLHQCQKAFRKTINEKHFGCVVQCIDSKVTDGLYYLKKQRVRNDCEYRVAFSVIMDI